MSSDQAIQDHWSPPGDDGLLERILQGLRESGADLENLRPVDLAPVDEFHIRGREATLEMAEFADIRAGERVLDVGSGIGGPSRLLATEHGCHVSGIDLTPEYCSAATALAEKTGLSDRVDYRQGSALELPFEDASFDVAWTQHVSMNIEDKSRMYSEMARVVRPGGRIALYDPILGSGESLHFPVPWANAAETSYLVNAEATREHLGAAGLEIRKWREVTDASAEWFRAKLAAGPAPVGLHLLMGSRWPPMAKNLLRNLEEGRVVVIQTVLERGSGA